MGILTYAMSLEHGNKNKLNWTLSSNAMFMVWAVFACLTLGACGKTSVKSKTKTPTTNKPSTDAGNQRDDLGKRYCEIEIKSSLSLSAWESRFAELFQWDVEGFENAPTLCAELDSYGSKLDGSIMIEYEDNQGIGYLSLTDSNLFYGNIKRSSSVTNIELIYNFSIDGVGFLIQLKGASSGSGQPIASTIRFHQLPSYEDQISDAIKEAQKKCKDGTWTVAQCLGYNFPPTYWWENSDHYATGESQQVKLAQELLKNNSKSKELGKVEFKLSDVTK